MSIVAILGDSRVFDTYYADAHYDQIYGYDKVFSHLLSKSMFSADTGVDVVHIPDHFRTGSIENNIVRLALTDPNLVVLCDGIWETLLNRRQFDAYAETLAAEGKDIPEYEPSLLVELFLANRLADSPQRYTKRQEQVISYFRRRRRQCIWMTLPVPDRDYLAGTYHAGKYRCIPEWGTCLTAVNEAITPMVTNYGAIVMNLNRLMEDHGGPRTSLIDQWHFSPSFHALLAKRLEALIDETVVAKKLLADHVSHRFMLPKEPLDDPVAVYGSRDIANQWIENHPASEAEIVSDATDLPDHPAEIVILAVENSQRGDIAWNLLRQLPANKIVLFVEETGEIDNPPAGREGEQGKRLWQ